MIDHGVILIMDRESGLIIERLLMSAIHVRMYVDMFNHFYLREEASWSSSRLLRQAAFGLRLCVCVCVCVCVRV